LIAIRGFGSAIAKALASILPEDEEVLNVGRHSTLPMDVERYLFCAGLLYGKSLLEAEPDEIADTLRVNFSDVAQACDRIIAGNGKARICVVGSESGFAGSYDVAYAGAKAALHRYVETKRLRTIDQQLVCIAPGILGDGGMTLRRKDLKRLDERQMAHPKARFLSSIEVARLIRFALYDDRGYLSGVVIRLNGGEHTA
jgi:NAD(P)-dependent dehydrogenase (short-subunit alcohol dehydrogenase family)